MQSSKVVYELRIYHAAPGKLAELLARFRDHTVKLFDRHGIKSIAYWTPIDEPQKNNTLIYILSIPAVKRPPPTGSPFRTTRSGRVSKKNLN